MSNLLREYFRDLENAGGMRVCLGCVQDNVIHSLFSNQPSKTCFACGMANHPSVDLERIAKLVRRRAEHVYEVDPELHSGYRGISLDELIAEMLLCKDVAVIEAVKSLIEVKDEPGATEDLPFFFTENTYRKITAPFESSDDEREYVVRRWAALTSGLTHRHRFFNKEAEDYFTQIFRESFQVTENTLLGERAVVAYEVPAGFEVYRARLANSSDVRDTINTLPEKEMGAPPSLSAKNNRMNPAGVSLFYGALDKETCIAEVRPSIGDNVALAKFVTNRPLKLFDFHGLDRQLRFPRVSPFEDAPQQRREHQAFLRYLHEEIAKPVRDDGMSYIVTQAMAEFFAIQFGKEFAGFCFKSIQKKGGRNVVVFGEAESTLAGEKIFPLTIAGSVENFVLTSVNYGFDLSTNPPK